MLDQDFLRQKIEQLGINQQSHYSASERLQRLHFVVGLIILVSSTTALAFNFSSGPGDGIGWKWAIGSFSFVAALCSGIQTFSNFSGRAKDHQSAGVAYGSLVRDLEFLFAHAQSLPDSEARLQQLMKEWREVSDAAPITALKIRTKFGDKVRHAFNKPTSA